MRPASTTRRRFLLGVLGALLAVPLASWRRFRPGSRGEPDPLRALARDMVSLFREPRSARVLGSLYLAQHPAEASLEFLVPAALGAAHGAVARGKRLALHRVLRTRNSEDFAAGRVVRLDGWVLAATEARLCALAALV